jgi:hypothetical protein
MGSRARWSEVVAWLIVAAFVLFAIVSFFADVFHMKWNAYSFEAGAVECVFVDATGEALLLVPIEQFRSDAHIDQVELIDAMGLELSGVGVLPRTQTVFGSGEQPKSDSLEALRSAVEQRTELGSITGPSTLAILVEPTPSLGYHGARGLSIKTITGEPAYWQDFALEFGVTAVGCRT